jgi:hypothetical protein
MDFESKWAEPGHCFIFGLLRLGSEKAALREFQGAGGDGAAVMSRPSVLNRSGVKRVGQLAWLTRFRQIIEVTEKDRRLIECGTVRNALHAAVAAIVAHLGEAGGLKPEQIIVAAIPKLLVICFGVLKTGKPFDPAIA